MTTAPPTPEATDAEETAAATLDRLLPATIAGINLDTMREAAPVIRARLIDLLRDSVKQLREARGTVVVPEDTYDTVRRVTAAQEVMTQWAQAFTAAAKECAAVLEEEALTANGGMPGYEDAPSGSLFVPDGAGQRIAVTPDWHSGESTWDVDTLCAWVAETIVADEGVGLDTDRPVFTAQEAVSLVRDGMDKLRRLGAFTPGAAKVEAERKRLAGLGRDADAAVLRQVRSVGNRRYKGVKVTREEAK
jgi:hypothetical protein